METKIFGGKKVKIRGLAKSDLKKAAKFKDFINSLVEEDAKIGMNVKVSIKEEINFLEAVISGVKNKKKVYILAECDDIIIGSASITQLAWRSNHIGELGITIRDGYRGLGLGRHLMQQVIDLAKKELEPKPKMIRLLVYVNNEPAIRLYKKLGFKKVARLPRQTQYKGELIDDFMMVLDL